MPPGVLRLACGMGWAGWIALVAPRTVLSPTAYAVGLLVLVVTTALLVPFPRGRASGG